MREAATSLLVGPGTVSTVTGLILDQLDSHPSHFLFLRRGTAGWMGVTALQFVLEATALAKGLIAGGVSVGDPVAVLSVTGYQRTLVEFAVWFAGGITVPLYPDLPAAQLTRVLQDSHVRRIFTQDATVSQQVAGVLESADLPAERIISTVRMDYDGDAPNLASLAAAGAGVSDAELERHRSSATSTDTASILYSAGPDSASPHSASPHRAALKNAAVHAPAPPPSGCRITHGNIVLPARNLAPLLPDVPQEERPRVLVVLPASGAAATTVPLAFLAAGITVAHGSADRLEADLQEVRPVFLIAGPDVVDAVYNEATRQAEASGQGRLFDAAARTAVEYSLASDTAKGTATGLAGTHGADGPAAAAGRPGKLLALRHAVFDRLVYRKLRAALGGQLLCIFTTGGALPADTGHFFNAAGIPVLDSYGCDETSGPFTAATPERNRPGTAGLPLPGTTVRIAADGEVLVKGIGVFAGYHEDPAATAAAFTRDFFRTGVTGSLDDDGYLTLESRKQEDPHG